MREPGAESAPLPFRVLIDDAARLARRHLRTIYVRVAVPVAAIQAVIAVVQFRSMRRFMDAMQGQDPAEFMAAWFTMIGPAIGIGSLIGLIYVAMYATCVDVVAGREPALAPRVRFVLRPRVLVTLLCAAVCLVLGFAACLLPGLIVGLLLSFVVPVMVEEKRYLFGAFARSGSIARYNPRRLPREHPMVKVFVLGVISVLLSYVVSFVIQMPIAIAQQVLVFRDVAETGSLDALFAPHWLWIQLPLQVLGSFATTAIQFYVAFGVALLYFDVRRRKDGSDLDAAIDRITGTP